jgi:RND family efflux transporter MFP subunit
MPGAVSVRVSLLIGICLFGGFPFGGISADPASGQKPRYSVQGITEPFRHAIISAEFASTLIAIRKNEGAFAKKGDTIFELDYRAAQLDAERCRLIADNKGDLNAAKLKAQTAKLDYNATQQLHDSGQSVSEEELWKKKLELDLTTNECERLTMLKEKDNVEYKIALERLSHYVVIAPFDGIVAERFLHEAESCKPQEPLLKFVDVHKCRFITYVPVERSGGLAKGANVTLTLGSGRTAQVRTGTIEFVSPVVDASSSLRTVKVVFDNSDGSIQPGVTGTLFIDK